MSASPTSIFLAQAMPPWVAVSSRLLFAVTGVVLHAGGLILLWSTCLAWPLPVKAVTALAGALLYALAQALRAVRLGVIVGDPERSLRRLTAAHFVGVAASFILPFKVGDLLRLTAIGTILGPVMGHKTPPARKAPWWNGLWRAFLVMWIERVYDAVAVSLLLLSLAAHAGAGSLSAIGPVAVVLIVFVVLTIVVLFVVPENLDGLSLFIARRYNGPRAVAALASLDLVYRLIAEGRRLAHRKGVTLATLTAGVWGLEVAAAARLLGDDAGGSTGALLGFLSGTLSATTAGHLGGTAVYPTVIGLPLIAAGLVAWYALALTGLATRHMRRQS